MKRSAEVGAKLSQSRAYTPGEEPLFFSYWRWGPAKDNIRSEGVDDCLNYTCVQSFLNSADVGVGGNCFCCLTNSDHAEAL